MCLRALLKSVSKNILFRLSTICYIIAYDLSDKYGSENNT